MTLIPRRNLAQALIPAAALITGSVFAACSPDPFEETDAGVVTDGGNNTDGGGTDGGPTSETIRLNDDITSNTTFTANNTYVLPRLKYVFVKDGATLTIEPGTVIKGEQGAVLVITRGSKIVAEGTAEKPITFTSAQADNAKTAGYWGGVLVLGKAPINNNVNSTPTSTEATFEAFTSAVPEGKFGGTDPHDNSGVLKYVRVEFGGFNFVADREFNNVTLCGVGDGTVVDYLQVHGGADDGIEFFGGTVNVKHLISSQNGDDGFDTDNGWQGKGQFIIVQNVLPQGSAEASNGYESDNHATAESYKANPRTLPTIYNATLIGKSSYTEGTSWAMVLRRGTGGHYFNHLIMGFQKGIEIRDLATKEQLDSDNLYFKNSIIFGNGPSGNPWPAAQASNDIDEKAYFEQSSWSNRFEDPGMAAAITSPTAPNFKPTTGAAALTGGATPPNDGFFDTSATFVGAVGAEDWTTGWTAFPQPKN